MNDSNIINKFKILINNFNSKNFLETITLAQKLLKKSPKHEAYLSNIIGLSYKSLNKLNEAEIYFKRIIDKYPGNIPAKNNYAMVLKAKQKLDEAEAVLEKALTQDPNYLSAINNLANIKKQKKNI